MKQLINLIVYVFFIVIVIESLGFVNKSVSKFYFFRIDRTSNATAIITSSTLYDGIEGLSYKCEFAYTVKDKGYKVIEMVSVDSTREFNINDTVQAIYNINRPFLATIDNDRDALFRLIASFCLIGGGIYSIIASIKVVLTFLNGSKIKK